MSFGRGNGQNGGHFYSNITQPVKIDFNFIVDSTNGNGLGIRSLKSNGYVNNVFMHTTVTPGVNNGITNPNPKVGVAMIQFKGNYNRLISGYSGVVSPTTGSPGASITAGNPYIIASLGNTTLAQWQTAGFPKGFTPAVGASFIATTTGSVAGTGTVIAPGVSQVCNAQIIGDPNQTISNAMISPYGGAYHLIQFIDYTGAVITPTDGLVISLSTELAVSSVSIDGL